ncbi:MAG: undecaprenyl-diphosphate phosphatase [Eubacteriales bacterium]|nr:undecaprenyl-diphosphate phosphatase [Eubacteriales bacterium]
MDIIEFFKSVLFGIVEGVTEWLPISSTGHMILLQHFMPLNVSEEFWKMFEVVVQLGAIMAVVILYWKKLWPFATKKYKKTMENKGKDIKQIGLFKTGAVDMWLKIIIACVPAAVIGLAFDDKIDELFYHPIPVALALIIVGVVFIVVESTIGKNKKPIVTKISQITYKDAVLIGLFQLVAAVFPGTSRSGATIVGGVIIGLSRGLAAEFTFFLAVPVMFGASLLKMVKYIAEVGFAFSGAEAMILVVGTLVAFFVSVVVIKFLMSYIKKHDFKVFGWYRIVLGILVVLVLR